MEFLLCTQPSSECFTYKNPISHAIYDTHEINNVSMVIKPAKVKPGFKPRTTPKLMANEVR